MFFCDIHLFQIDVKSLNIFEILLKYSGISMFLQNLVIYFLQALYISLYIFLVLRVRNE